MDVEITVVDDSDIVGWLASATREGEIYMTNVQSMVDNIFRALRVYTRTCNPAAGTPYNKMSRLNILDHGNSTSIQIGSDRVSVGTLPTFRPTLALLAGNFSTSGFVHLQHCDAGQNRPLLLSLAQIFRVPVYAGTGAHNPVYRFNRGGYVRANPDGTFSSDAGRP
jgi:hypothetical protein